MNFRIRFVGFLALFAPIAACGRSPETWVAQGTGSVGLRTSEVDPVPAAAHERLFTHAAYDTATRAVRVSSHVSYDSKPGGKCYDTSPFSVEGQSMRPEAKIGQSCAYVHESILADGVKKVDVTYAGELNGAEHAFTHTAAFEDLVLAAIDARVSRKTGVEFTWSGPDLRPGEDLYLEFATTKTNAGQGELIGYFFKIDAEICSQRGRMVHCLPGGYLFDHGPGVFNVRLGRALDYPHDLGRYAVVSWSGSAKVRIEADDAPLTEPSRRP